MATDIRDRIMKEALREINRRGAAFHMDDLARTLRISKRTLYEHFPSKQEIIKEAILSLISKIYDKHVMLLANPSLSTEEKIIEFFNFKGADIAILSVRKTDEILQKMPEIHDILKEAKRKDWDLLSTLLDQALEEEGFKQFDKILLLHMLKCSTNEMIEYFNDVEQDYSFTEYMEKCVRVILYGIKEDRRQNGNDSET